MPTAAPASPSVHEWTPPPLTRRERLLTMAGVLLALLLAGLDQTIIATAGPAIQRDLRIAPALYAWITTAYLVGATVMLPIFGKLSDSVGRKPILLVGVGLFLLGSFLCGAAPGTVPLIVFRVIQGLGAASLFTTTFAVIADLFSPAERGKYMGLIGGVMGLASVVGPLVGGILTDTLGWRWVFYVNLPVGALALWFIVTKMPRLHARAGEARAPVDIAGGAALVTGVVPLLIALSLGRVEVTATDGGYAWGSLPILGMFALALLGLVVFVLIERRAADPILDLRLFRDRIIGYGSIAVFVLGAAFLFGIIFLPLFLVNVLGVSATAAGLAMTPLTLGIVTGSIAAGQIVSRVGHYKRLMLGSLVLLAIGFGVMATTLTETSTYGGITLKMLLVGLGIGPSLPLYTLAMQNAAPMRDVGVVTAAATFSRSLGQVIGVAAFGALFTSALTSAIGDRMAPVLAGVPEEARGVVAAALAPPAGGEAEGARVVFDSVLAAARIRDAVTVGSGVLGATTANPGIVSGPQLTPDQLDVALAAVGRAAVAFEGAFAAAIRALYGAGTLVVALGFLITLAIPERPLRREGAGQV